MAQSDAATGAKGGVTIPPDPEFAAKAHVKSFDQYMEMYNESINNPEKFWGDVASEFHWHKKWDKVREYEWGDSVSIKFFTGGQTNISYNCLDRHLETRGDQTAIIWEGNEPGDDAKLTYRELHAEVCQFANVLKDLGVEKGDRVCLYLQMIPQLPVAMLACARIGAIHSVVFGAFSADALRDRIQDSECKILVTQDTALRGPKNNLPMKTNADKAVAVCPSIEKVVVVNRTGNEVPMTEGRDVWWEPLMAAASADCPPVWMDAEDPCSSSIRRDRPASRRAYCTRPAATWSTPHRPSRTSSTITTAMSGGVRPISAG